MTGAVVGSFLAVLCALAVLLVLLTERRPSAGWRAWLRDSIAAWRAEDLKSERIKPRRNDVREAGIHELFELGPQDPAPAYTRPEEIAARLEQAKEQARTLARR